MAQTTSAYELHRPHLLWAEIEGDIWWRAVCNTVRTVLAAARVDPSAIAGIGVDGVGWTLIAVDRAGVPLHPAMIWLDRRAEDETLWLKSLPAADHLVNLNANRLDAAYITPKLLWLKRHQPDVFNSAHKFLEATGFIISALQVNSSVTTPRPTDTTFSISAIKNGIPPQPPKSASQSRKCINCGKAAKLSAL